MTKRLICAAAVAAAIGSGAGVSGSTVTAQAPAESTPSKALNVPYTEFTLPNGLNVILHRDTSVPVVAVNIWYHVGSANERPGRTGFAHLFEHVMFEGSSTCQEGEFDNWLEAAGGNNNGSTTDDRTNYYDRRAVQRARAGAVPRVAIAWATCSTTRSPDSSTASATS